MQSTRRGPGSSLIDLHCHILPGVDDGSQSMRESLGMARIAVASGVGTIVTTPHSNQVGRFENYATPQLQRVFEAFCKELERNRIPLRVLPGMEIFAVGDVVEKIRHKLLCPIAGTQYYLVEFPFSAPADEIEHTLREMLAAGFVPLIAHPERYACVQREPQRLAHWRALGCAAQLNRGSVQGRFGTKCAAAADFILQRGLADVFGSDAHSAYRRTPELGSLREYLTRRVGGEQGRRLLEINPTRLLNRETLADGGHMNASTGESAR